jgi:glycosyltransferase involved in cell wall biosynthesis
MTPSISIITPSFNQGRFIERTIQSVLSQNVSSIEYIVMDGGSTDETVSILKQYDARLMWVTQKDRGPSDAINQGIQRTSAPIVGWINSDDIYYPDALNTVIEYFKTHPEVDVAYGDAHHVDENDVVLEQYPTEDWDWERLKNVCFISQPAAFLRREVFVHYGALDIQVRNMDYEYWLRLGKNGVRFAHLPKLLAATRLHPEAFTVAARVAAHKSMNDFTRRHLGRTPDRWLFNYAHVVLDSKGLSREHHLRFVIAVSVISYYAALRWNKRISAAMFKTTAHWIGGTAKVVTREALQR